MTAAFRALAWAGLFAAPAIAVAGEPAAVAVTPAVPAPPKVAPGQRLSSVFRKSAPTTITDLRTIEARVKVIVAQVSPAVVSVSLRSGGSGVISGSAVVISADGLVLTAAHVGGAPGRDVTFTFPDGRTAKGKTLGTNHDLDAGLMRITDAGPWPFAPVGDLAAARLGDWVVALGHPGGFDAQRPVVARLGRIIMKTARTMQTDCIILSGDSGGPLFDSSGRVIGIHSSISTQAEDNFHVPITTFLETWTRLAGSENWGTPAIASGGRGRGGRDAGATGSVVPEGIKIDTVAPTGRAQRVQLQPGDIVLKFNGRAVTTPADFLAQLAATEEKLTVTIKRGGQQLDLNYTPNTNGGRGGQGGVVP
jgi:serine protease Do